VKCGGIRGWGGKGSAGEKETELTSVAKKRRGDANPVMSTI